MPAANETSTGADLLGIGDQKTNSTALTIGTRVNYSIPLNTSGLSLTPSAGFSYTRGKGGKVNFTDPTSGTAATLTMGDTESLVTFAGATLVKVLPLTGNGASQNVFIATNIYSDLKGGRTSSFDDQNGGHQDIKTNGLGSFGEVSLGYSYVHDLSSAAGKASQVFMSVRADVRAGPQVSKAYSLTAQVRLTF